MIDKVREFAKNGIAEIEQVQLEDLFGTPDSLKAYRIILALADVVERVEILKTCIKDDGSRFNIAQEDGCLWHHVMPCVTASTTADEKIGEVLGEKCGKCGGSGIKSRDKHCEVGVCVKHHEGITCHPSAKQCEYYIPNIPCPACSELEPCNICNDTGYPYIDCQNEHSGYDMRHFCLCPLGQYKKTETEKKSNSTYYHSDPSTDKVEKRKQREDDCHE